MKVVPQQPYAVLTGDVVGSSKLAPAKRAGLPGLLQQASRDTRKAFPGAVPLEVDVFRGDSWQLLVKDAALSLRVALHFRAALLANSPRGRGLDTRIALAIGAVDFVPKRVSQGDGDAYRRSGQLLDALGRREFLRLSLPGDTEAGLPAAAVRLIDAVAQAWTGPQALAICGALRGWGQDKIVTLWPEPILQSVASRHLEKARWEPISAGLTAVEAVLPALLKYAR